MELSRAIAALDPGLRARIGQTWREMALLEHASVGSFARFTLQLLAVGAPADLVEAAQQAGLDEVRHARRCFRMASAYGGSPVGPGPLPVEGDLLGDLDLAALAAATVHEGCVGETLGALEAQEALQRVELPDVRDTLETIAVDEARHAELAWAFVRWAMSRGGDSVRAAVEAAFAEAMKTQSHPPAVDPDEATLRRHGLLTRRCQARVHATGRVAVVQPAVEALLKSGSA